MYKYIIKWINSFYLKPITQTEKLKTIGKKHYILSKKYDCVLIGTLMGVNILMHKSKSAPTVLYCVKTEKYRIIGGMPEYWFDDIEHCDIFDTEMEAIEKYNERKKEVYVTSLKKNKI